MYESDEYRTVLINCIQSIFEQCILHDVHTVLFLSLFSSIIIIFVLWCALKFCFYLFATYCTHLFNMNKFRHARCIMLIPKSYISRPLPTFGGLHDSGSWNLSGGLQTLKYCIYVYFDNRPVYDASLLSLWKHTMVCKISLCISCWMKNSWVLSPICAQPFRMWNRLRFSRVSLIFQRCKYTGFWNTIPGGQYWPQVKIKILVLQFCGQYCCAHSSQISDWMTTEGAYLIWKMLTTPDAGCWTARYRISSIDYVSSGAKNEITTWFIATLFLLMFWIHPKFNQLCN